MLNHRLIWLVLALGALESFFPIHNLHKLDFSIFHYQKLQSQQRKNYEPRIWSKDFEKFFFFICCEPDLYYTPQPRERKLQSKELSWCQLLLQLLHSYNLNKTAKLYFKLWQPKGIIPADACKCTGSVIKDLLIYSYDRGHFLWCTLYYLLNDCYPLCWCRERQQHRGERCWQWHTKILISPDLTNLEIW